MRGEVRTHKQAAFVLLEASIVASGSRHSAGYGFFACGFGFVGASKRLALVLPWPEVMAA